MNPLVLFSSFFLFCSLVYGRILDNEYARGIARISVQLPNLNYSIQRGIWAKLEDGRAYTRDVYEYRERNYDYLPEDKGGCRDHRDGCHDRRDRCRDHRNPCHRRREHRNLSPFVRSAVLERNPIIFTDLNGDGLVDALVVLRVTYTGIGYFDLFVVPVIMRSSRRAYVPRNSGFRVGETSIYAITSFDLVGDNQHVRITFMDRRRHEPKATRPSIPTVLTLRYNRRTNMLEEVSKRIVSRRCFFDIFRPTC